MINLGLASSPALFRQVPVLRAAVLYRQHNQLMVVRHRLTIYPAMCRPSPSVPSMQSKVVPWKKLLNSLETSLITNPSSNLCN